MKTLVWLLLVCFLQISFVHLVKSENQGQFDVDSGNFKESHFFKKISNLDSLIDSDDLSSIIENDSNKQKTEKEKFKLKSGSINPVILIPGLEGSQLMATLSKKESNHYYCKKTQKTPFLIWINYEEFTIPAVNCFVENMQLHYNNETRKTKNTDGVNVEVPGFGSTESIEILTDNRFAPQYYYYKSLVDSLTELGYERNKTVRGAPFDFRLAPNEQDDYFKNLIDLIESTYMENNKRKVIIVCHSMGCLYTMNLLNVRVNESWKNRYISTLFALSSPWSGSIRALKTMVTGDNMGIFLFNDKRFKDMERTFPSIAFLLPNPSKFDLSIPVVITPSQNYTFDDYETLFERMNQTTIYDMYADTSNLIGDLRFPNVDMHCIYGTGIDTERQLIYDKDSNFPLNPKKIIYTKDGDSSVNLESLEYCLRWKNQKKYKFSHLKIDKGDHLDLIRQNSVLDYIKQEIIKISLHN